MTEPLTRNVMLEKARTLSEQFLRVIDGHQRFETDLGLAITLLTCLEIGIESMQSPVPETILNLQHNLSRYIEEALAAVDRLAAKNQPSEKIH